MHISSLTAATGGIRPESTRPRMDYAAEQEMELEALAAIFADDFKGNAAALDAARATSLCAYQAA